MRGDYEMKILAIPLISTKRTNTPKKPQDINVLEKNLHRVHSKLKDCKSKELKYLGSRKPQCLVSVVNLG